MKHFMLLALILLQGCSKTPDSVTVAEIKEARSGSCMGELKIEGEFSLSRHFMTIADIGGAPRLLVLIPEPNRSRSDIRSLIESAKSGWRSGEVIVRGEFVGKLIRSPEDGSCAFELGSAAKLEKPRHGGG